MDPYGVDPYEGVLEDPCDVVLEQCGRGTLDPYDVGSHACAPFFLKV